MDVFLLRHGETEGNRQGRYIGATDQPLSARGREALRQQGSFDRVERVYVSPLLRARQTARLLFPQARLRVVDDLREMNFGSFEGRTAEEMRDDPGYRAWVDSDCRAACPGGEDIGAFRARTCAAFERIAGEALAAQAPRLILVTHGGSIMAIMSRYARPGRPYFAWRVNNGCGYRARLDEAAWAQDPGLSAWQLLEELRLC